MLNLQLIDMLVLGKDFRRVWQGDLFFLPFLPMNLLRVLSEIVLMDFWNFNRENLNLSVSVATLHWLNINLSFQTSHSACQESIFDQRRSDIAPNIFTSLRA